MQSQVKAQFLKRRVHKESTGRYQLVPTDTLCVAPHWCSKGNRTRSSYFSHQIIFFTLYYQQGQFLRQFIQVQLLLRSLRSNSRDIKPTFFPYWSSLCCLRHLEAHNILRIYVFIDIHIPNSKICRIIQIINTTNIMKQYNVDVIDIDYDTSMQIHVKILACRVMSHFLISYYVTT